MRAATPTTLKPRTRRVRAAAATIAAASLAVLGAQLLSPATAAAKLPVIDVPRIDLHQIAAPLLGDAGSSANRFIVPTAARPAAGRITSGFGPRWGSHHNGIDIANNIGAPVHSAAFGTVLNAGAAPGYGQWVRIQQDDGTVAIYGHVEQIFVVPGQPVFVGQQIATVGNRGHSTGPHLHFEVHRNGVPINPVPWLASRGVFL